jgi:hypothetical protein
MSDERRSNPPGPIWITPKIPASELDGRTIELRVATRSKELRGKGRIRIQPHRATSGLFCLWVDFDLPVLGSEHVPLQQIEANYIQSHPDSSAADYLCEVQYSEDSRQ